VDKNAKQRFFCQHHYKRPKNMPNSDVDAKLHFLMPNHFNKAQFLEFDIKNDNPANQSAGNPAD